MKKDYDVVVIGAGSGGLTAASGFSKVGKSVLLIEREHMGGECTNSGCVPSKALLHHAKVFHAASSVSGKNKKLEEHRTKALAYVRSKVDAILEHETPEIFREKGIDVELGDAEFIAPCTVQVSTNQFGFKHAVTATGSSPRMIDIAGINQNDVLTNQNIFELTNIPERLLIIGAGPIGMEMGQAFSMLGSKVTIADVNNRFARLEDEAISPIAQKVFATLGITIHLNAFIKEVENKQAIFDIKETEGKTTIREERVVYDKILLAVGRVPNFPKGLDAAGIKSDVYSILVDSQHRTSNKYVYAVGDVAQRLKFTHTADDNARQVVTHVISKGFLRADTKKAVPKVTYTEPEIAQVGMSYKEALQKYTEKEVMRIEVPFSENDRAHTDDDTSGLLVVYARRLNGVVLGANIIGPRAGELITTFTLAIDQKISMWSLRQTIFAYPTYSLIIKRAGDIFFAEQISSLKKDITNLILKHAPKILALVFWLGLIFTFQKYKIENNFSYQDMVLHLFDFFTASMYGPLVFIVLYAIRPLILFPATLLTALSGALFGLWGGIIYTVIGENLSANFAYWIGRFFGKDLQLEDSLIGNWVEALRKRPFESVLFMRLFYFPFDLTNYGNGILKVPWLSYFLATVIGIMPGLSVFVALGAAINIEEFKMDGISFDIFDPWYLALSVTIFIVSLILSKLLKRWKAEV